LIKSDNSYVQLFLNSVHRHPVHLTFLDPIDLVICANYAHLEIIGIWLGIEILIY